MGQPGINFGIGYAAAIPSGANPTPIPFAVLNDISIDYTIEYKKARGQWKHPVAVGAGAVDVTGKVGSITMFASAIARVTGGTVAAGSTIGLPGETATIPSTPFQVTVANSATWTADHGVLDLTAGLYMTRVASSPTTGQYSVAAGVYTFAAADTGHSVSIAYGYTSAAGGKTVSIVNSTMSLETGVELVVYGPAMTGPKVCGVRIFNAYFPKLSLALKADDFTAQEVEFFLAQSPTSTEVMKYFSGD